jgi:hypothetical protein
MKDPLEIANLEALALEERCNLATRLSGSEQNLIIRIQARCIILLPSLFVGQWPTSIRQYQPPVSSNAPGTGRAPKVRVDPIRRRKMILKVDFLRAGTPYPLRVAG